MYTKIVSTSGPAAFASVPDSGTYLQLALVWGVEPLLVDQITDTDAMIVAGV